MKQFQEFKKGKHGDFCRLLREVQAGRESCDALLVDPLFKERLRLMISAHRQKPEDAEEMANDIRTKVWRYLPGFEPDYTCDYGNFFAWLRTIIRNTFLDTLSKSEVEYDKERAEDLDSKDPRIDIEGQLLYKERVKELESCISALPERERLATTWHILEGLPSRITAERLTQKGYPCTHVTVLKWVRDGLKPFFPNAEGFSVDEVQRKASKHARPASSPSLKRPEPSPKKRVKS